MHTHKHTFHNNMAPNGFWEVWLYFYAVGQTRNPNNETPGDQYIMLKIYESYCQTLFCITKYGILMITWRKRHILAKSFCFYQVRRHFASCFRAEFFSLSVCIYFFHILFSHWIILWIHLQWFDCPNYMSDCCLKMGPVFLSNNIC